MSCDQIMARAHRAEKRIAELEAERTRLLADNVALREALENVKVRVAFIGHPGEAFWEANGIMLPDWRSELAAIDAALTAPATDAALVSIRRAEFERGWNHRNEHFKIAESDALDRVRKQAQAEVLDWLVAEADRQRSSIVRAFGQVDPGDILEIAVKKAAELRGGE